MAIMNDRMFYIKSGDLGFSSRQKNIFDQINALEKAVTKPEDTCYEMDNTDEFPTSKPTSNPGKRLRSQTKQFRGKESIFKRPEAPPPRFKMRNTPDYQRNPHKWTKYSLGDVSQDDMSNQSNTAAALAFLREIEERKATSSKEDDSTSNHIVFKPKKTSLHNEDPLRDSSSISTCKAAFRSTKLIMPEYVVGKEKRNINKKHKLISSENNQTNKIIKLEHLIDEDAE